MLKRQRLWMVLGILLGLTATTRAQPIPTSNPADAIAQEIAQTNRALETQLARKLPEVKFDGNGFGDVIDFLRDVTGINIFVNWKAIEQAGIKKETPVTVRLKDVPASAVIETILESAAGGKNKLGTVTDEGVLTISTVDDLDADTITKTYDVRFLLPETLDAKSREKQVAIITTMIKGTIAPATWATHDGQSFKLRELQGQLIITQTPKNQAMIGNLVTQLRNLTPQAKP